MHGFSFIIYGDFAHFRNPFTLSFLESFPAPVKTTIIGILGAASGFNEVETIELGKKIKIGIKILRIDGFIRDIVRMHNLENLQSALTDAIYKQTYFYDAEGLFKFKVLSGATGTPIMRQVIVNPTYKIFVFSEDFDLLSQLSSSLRSPTFPIYLGISDFLARIDEISDIKSADKREIELISTREVDSVFPISTAISIKNAPLDKFSTEFIEEITLLENQDFVLLPRKYRTILSFESTKKGRKPTTWIDLVMFYNCKLKLKNSMESYKIDGENIVLL